MKVSKEDVRYLIFEGGGGKGVAYLGAVKALEELGILSYFEKEVNGKTVNRLDSKKIHGVAGTSVGSFTALLIACGYTPKEAEHIITDNMGTKLLDSVEFDKIPTVYTSENPAYVIDNPFIETDQLLLDKYLSKFIESEKKTFGDFLKIPGKAFSQLNFKFLSTVFKWYVYYEAKKVNLEEEEHSYPHEFIASVPEIVSKETTKRAFDTVVGNPSDSFSSLKHEYGYFLATAFREAVDKCIEQKSGITNCTFKQFADYFEIDLVVTGFDVATNEVFYFRNNEKWGDLCVADAIRMSISIPLVFKPVLMSIEEGKIKSAHKENSLIHYIVDGGLGNSFPLHVFDKPNSQKLNPKVLGFNLDFIRPFSEGNTTFFGFLENMFLALLKMTTETQFRTNEERDQAITLNSRNISVLDFDYKVLPTNLIEESRKTTLEYFQ